MDTIAIIPTYNEAENVERLVKAVLANGGIHVLIVDDNSPDGTGEIAKRLADKNPSVKVIHRKEKLGLGPAYIEGFRYALDKGYRFIIQMDCDFSHDPEDIPRLMEEMKRNGADLVIGSRYVKGGKITGWPIARHILSRGGNMYARLVLGPFVRDWTTGFKLYRAEVLGEILRNNSYADGYAFLAEMTYRTIKKGYNVKEVPIVFRERTAGESKMGKSIIIEAARRVLRLRREG